MEIQNRVMNFQDSIDKVFGMYQSKNDVILDEVPSVLKPDLMNFIYGATLYKNPQGKWILPYVDFAQWHNKLIAEGIGKSKNKYGLWD